MLVLAIAAAVPSAPAEPVAADPSCPNVQNVDVLGLACLNGNGLYSVYSPGGEFLGYTHGVDQPANPGTVGTALASVVPPSCVVSPTASDYYAKVFYVRPTDVPDAYAAKKATIVSTVSAANGWIHDAAVATGGLADVKVECDSGGVRVISHLLTTTRAATTFASIVTDLWNSGYTEINAKHWVFVDGGASNICSCGVGHIYGDDSLSASNLNNGPAGTGAEFAVNFDMTSDTIAIHELSHNMGAVQHSAPHTTWLPPSDDSNAWHCNDGYDIMCYNDGGHNTGGRCSSTNFDCAGSCAIGVYDCGKDDYFNRNPAAGSYLATHWNVGNPLNRFLNFNACAGRMAVIYENSGLSGPCRGFDADEDDYTGLSFTSGVNMNDQGSGATVMSGRILTLYKDVSYGGASIDLVGSTSLLPAGWNDQPSSHRVRLVGAPCAADAWVTVYQDSGYGGGCRAWNNGLVDWRTATPTTIVETSLASLLYNNAASVDNSVTAIKVRYPFKITLYSDPDSLGSSVTYGEGQYSYVGSSWNDVASSATIGCVLPNVPLSVCDLVGDTWATVTSVL